MTHPRQLPPPPTAYSSALRVLSWLASAVALGLFAAIMWHPDDAVRLLAAALCSGIFAAAASATADEADEREEIRAERSRR